MNAYIHPYSDLRTPKIHVASGDEIKVYGKEMARYDDVFGMPQ